MKTSIYYFSGTGNSLAVAQGLAAHMENVTIISIPSVMNREEITDDADCIGFVFPVYFLDMPFIVQEFARKLRPEKDPYLFAVSTCGQNPGHALFTLAKILKTSGRRLSAGFALVMPENFLAPVDLMERPEIQRQKNYLAQKKIPGIAAVISHQQSHGPDGTGSVTSIILGKIAGTLMGSLYRTPVKFHATDACTGCRTCQKICPTESITVEGKTVTWGTNCTQCYACIHWCPVAAIEIGKRSVGKSRYHHPDIRISDMILR